GPVTPRPRAAAASGLPGPARAWLDAVGGVAGVGDGAAVADDPVVLAGRVVGDADDAVLAGEQLRGQRPALRAGGVVPHRGQVVGGDVRPVLPEQLPDLEGGRLARVVHVLLGGRPEDPAALERLGLLVQSLGDAADDGDGCGPKLNLRQSLVSERG